MRIALINDGTYPYRPSAVATWCHRLVRGLDEHTFHLITFVDAEAERRFPAPVNTVGLTPVPRSGQLRPPMPGPAQLVHVRNATHAAMLLCRGMLGDSPHSAAMFRSALRRFTALAADGTQPTHGVPLAAVLLDAWRATGHPKPPGQAGPTVRDAQTAAVLLEWALRPLAVMTPRVDLCHAVDSGATTLLALATKWRYGTPYVLSEHRPYPQPNPWLEAAPNALLACFLRALTRLGYDEAAAIIPASVVLRDWALRHGADRDRVTVIQPGVDPRAYPPLRAEPAGQVLAFIGPKPRLGTMLEAFTTVRGKLPDSRLLVTGAAPAGPPTGPPGVSFTGPVTRRRDLYAQASAVVVCGSDEQMPYPLIESMMSGRATICLDDAGLAPNVGIGAVMVRTGERDAIAAACVDVLGDRRLRNELSLTGRQRARTLFNLGAMLDGYRRAYAAVSLAHA